MILKKENPKSKMRTKLLKELMARNLSVNTLMELTQPLEDLTDEQKEEKASQILTIVTSCKTESEMLKKLSEMQTAQASQ